MDWKTFVKPDWKKVLLTVILFGASSLYVFSAGIPLLGKGLPLGFYFFCSSAMECVLADFPFIVPHLDYLALIIDLIFWYLIASVIVFAYAKLQGKPKSRGRKK